MKLEISLSLKKKNKKKIVLPIFLFYSNHKKNKQTKFTAKLSSLFSDKKIRFAL